MKYFIVAGEPSGDKHASKLVPFLKQLDRQSSFQFVGGESLQDAIGYMPKLHFREMAFMGFVEVIKNITKISANFKCVKKAITDFNPDMILLVDYPGFNLRLAKWAKRRNYRVTYYITPSVWAWHESRVNTIKKYTDLVIPILPFEESFFTLRGLDATYLGNPVNEAITKYLSKHQKKSSGTYIALLPGSRLQEINLILPVMLKVAAQFQDTSFKILKAPNIDLNTYEKYLDTKILKNVIITEEPFYDMVSAASAAIVTSGTATLETALLACPQVVVYRTSSISYAIAKRLVKLKFISLVNLLTNEANVVELIQDECNPRNISMAITDLLSNKKNAVQLQERLQTILGHHEVASRVSEAIYEAAKS